MRLGGPVFQKFDDPAGWVQAVKDAGYRACLCPVSVSTPDDVVQEYRKAIEEADIVLAEVGAWSNPLSPDEETRKKALENCKMQLDLAERAGARCCVNISGSRGDIWDGPHPDNLTDETFDMIVETTRDIIDTIQPKQTYYTIEPMPYMYPDTADNYLRLLKAVDRERFAVHFDPVNMVSSPQIYYNTGDFVRDCVKKLGPYIKSVHLKDIVIREALTVHLDEEAPGKGGFDFASLLKAVDALGPDTPLILEHLQTEEQYKNAAEHIRGVAKEAGVSV
ncbi:MAG: sugar phosphate isomerase/epimerase family protein [Candidatus Sumerlaeota bacterium]